MAILHEATITPTKDELVGPWLETRAWWDEISERGPVGTFRLDDPEGEVGMECFLLGSAPGSTLFVPLSYRGAELPGAEEYLLGTMEHSVLGQRWVYDGCADPVFVSTVIETIRRGGVQAELHVHLRDGSEVVREPSARVRGSGAELQRLLPSPGQPIDEADRTLVRVGPRTLSVARRVGATLAPGPRLMGEYDGGAGLLLATLS